MSVTTHTHTWQFSLVGGVKRVNINTGADLRNLEQLDPKLWTALSCPIYGLEIDQNTLGLIDTDNDGQIRVPEVIDAVNWICRILKDPGDIIRMESRFPIEAIDDSTEEGKLLLESARIILKAIGNENGETLSVAESGDTDRIFAATRFNGDGVISLDTTTDEELSALISEIMAKVGAVKDRSGKDGITADLLNEFFDECGKCAAWNEKMTADPTTILPFGDATAAAHASYMALKAKVDDFFIRCRLAAFDPQSTTVLNLQVARVEHITARDLSASMSEIAEYPIARIEAGNTLPVLTGINPAWEQQIATFKKEVTDKLFAGKSHITEQEWNSLAATFGPYAAWQQTKEGTKVESLGLERINAILSGNKKAQLDDLIAQDNAVAKEANNILMVNKLVRYHRDLFKLLKNFVTFFDFYTPGSKAIFQAGTLYIDQRSCDLCINVKDMGRQNTLAKFSGMYLLYCACVSKSTNEKMTIVATLTNGDIDNLVVGRNALFYDRNGHDWDATIVKIIENPISIRQAFYAPYRKASRFIESNINKMASSQDDKITKDMNSNIESMPAKAEESKTKKEATPFDIGKFVGIFAAIGLALGAIGSILAAAVGGFIKLEWWKMPIAVLGLLLLISGPSMVMAYLKLRKRNLAPILDANGWAINANVAVNIRFGKTLTHLAQIPYGSSVNMNDPFAKKKQPVWPVAFLIGVLLGVALYLMIKHHIINLHF